MCDATLILAVASLADAISAHIRGDEGRAIRKLEQVDRTLQKAAEQVNKAHEVVVNVHGPADRAAEVAANNAAVRRSVELVRRGATSAAVYVPRRRD